MNENIHNLIEEYVQKCTYVIETNDKEKAIVLWQEVSGIFGELIQGYFDYLSGHMYVEKRLNDLPSIVGKLRVYGAKLNHDIEIARLSQPITTVSQTTTVDINATFTQATTFVMDSEFFSPEETSEILIKIKELKNLAMSSENKTSKWEKVKPILEWTIARGVEIAPVLIPLIAAALK